MKSFCKSMLFKLALILFYFVSNLSSSYAKDAYLLSRVREFDATSSYSEKESISGDIFFLGDSFIKSGNSAKALKYLRAALEMTPHHRVIINKKMRVALEVFLKYSKKIKDCSLLIERYKYIVNIAPDRSQELHDLVSKCEKLKYVAKVQFPKRTSSANLAYDIGFTDGRTTIVNELEKLAKLHTPQASMGIEKKYFQEVFSEIEHTIFMKSHVPEDLILSLQVGSLKFLNFFHDKPLLDHKSVSETSSRLLFKYHVEALFEEERRKHQTKFKELLAFKGGGVCVKLNGKNETISSKVWEFINITTRLQKKNYDYSRCWDGELLYPSIPLLSLSISVKEKEVKLFYPARVVHKYGAPFKELNILSDRISVNRGIRKEAWNLSLELPNTLIKNMSNMKVRLDADLTLSFLRYLNKHQIHPLKSHYLEGKAMEAKFFEREGKFLSGILIRGGHSSYADSVGNVNYFRTDTFVYYSSETKKFTHEFHIDDSLRGDKVITLKDIKDRSSKKVGKDE